MSDLFASENRQHWRQRRLLATLLLLAIISVLAAFSYVEVMRLRMAPIVTWQTEKVDAVASNLARELGHIRTLSVLLKNSAAMKMALNQDQSIDKPALQALFSRFGKANRTVSQLRWIDNDGFEQVRVNFKEGKAEFVPDEQLQSKLLRYYFYQSMRMGAGEVYISPIDLNIEHGKPVTPLEPTIRSGIRTGFGDNLHTGVLIINYNLAKLFEEVRLMRDDASHLELVNQDSYWMIHPDPNREWGDMLGQPKQNLQQSHPSTWKQLTLKLSFNGAVLEDRIITSQRISQSSNRYDDMPSNNAIWIIAASSPQVLEKMRVNTAAAIGVSALILLLLGSLLINRWLDSEYQRHKLLVQVKAERDALKHAYQELSLSHERQQLLQNELAETKKLSSLGLMVAGVAHELNTPTGGALMVITDLRNQIKQLLDREHAPTRELQHMLRGLELAERHLQQAARQIRSFKRLASDRSAEDWVKTDLAELSRDLLLSLRSRLKHTHIEIDNQIADDFQLYTCPGVLSQILQNLIENALSHGYQPNDRGTITLAARIIDEHEQPIIEIQVTDTGCGIREDMIEKIFDPFMTSGRGQGHCGLGLHLVHQWITNTLRGTIHVTSVVNEGTTFTIHLPQSLAEPLQS